jgi:hypothetical protein
LLGAVVVTREATIDNETLLAMAYALCISERVHRLCKRQVVHGIEDVGFACAIVSNEAVDACRERYILALDVLEVYD